MIESDYYTCKYAWPCALTYCAHPAKCLHAAIAEEIDVKTDCKKCKYYKQEEEKNEN